MTRPHVIALVACLLTAASALSLPPASAQAHHGPILIEGDGNFTAENGVVSGSGTPSDPYVIENWWISGPAGVWAVDVRNTSAHFTLRNNSISGWVFPGEDRGLRFTNVSNARVEKNTIWNQANRHETSIDVNQCKNVLVAENTLKGGMQVRGCTDIVVEGNAGYWTWFHATGLTNLTLRSNTLDPPHDMDASAVEGTNLAVKDNRIRLGWYAAVGRATGTQVDWSGNSVEPTDPSWSVFKYGLTLQVDHGRFESNSLSGITNSVSLTVTQSRDVLVRGNAFSSCSRAIRVEGSQDVMVVGNAISFCSSRGYMSLGPTPAAIHAYGTNVTVSGNLVTNSGNIGIQGSRVLGNTVSGAGYYGIAASGLVEGNLVTGGVRAGLFGPIGMARNNTILRNPGWGILAESPIWGGTGGGGTFVDNRVEENGGGLQAQYWAPVNATHNRFIRNTGWGVHLRGASPSTLIDNEFEEDGLFVEGTSKADYTSHTIAGNTANGRPIHYLHDCDKVSMDNVPAGQVLAFYCTNLRLSRLVIERTDVAIQAYAVTGLSLYGLRLAGNDYGGHFKAVQNVLLRSSVLSGNDRGLFVDGASRVALRLNVFQDNGIAAAALAGGTMAVCANAFLGGGDGLSASVAGLAAYGNRYAGNEVGLRLSGPGAVVLGGANAFEENGLHVVGASQALFQSTYPDGGSYWADEPSRLPADARWGPRQDRPGSDGIADEPYVIAPGVVDRYPLAKPPVLACGALPPRDVAARVAGADVTLSWKAPADLDFPGDYLRYEVYRRETYHPLGWGYSLVHIVPMTDVVPQPGAGYVDLGAGEGNNRTYFYRVCAVRYPSERACAPQVLKVAVALRAGTSVVGIPVELADPRPASVFPAEVTRVSALDAFNQTWKSWRPGRGGSLTAIAPTEGYWVLSAANVTLVAAGALPPSRTISLPAGWNLIAYGEFYPQAINALLWGVDSARPLDLYDPEGPEPFPLRDSWGDEVVRGGEALVLWIFTPGTVSMGH